MARAHRSFATRAARVGLEPVARATGLTSYNLLLLRRLTRAELLLHGMRRLPPAPIEFTPADPVDDSAVELAERLIASYSLATGTQDASEQTTGMWSWIIGTRYGELAGPLARRDAPELAAALCSMCRREFIVGIAPGRLGVRSAAKLGGRVWRLTTILSLLSLAESVGIVRMENPEQGATGYALAEGVDSLAAKIEAALQISIDFPRVGAAFGIRAGARLIPAEAPGDVYGAVRVRDAFKLHLSEEGRTRPRIVEIGAGYGGLAMWLLRLEEQVAGYTLVDLPIVNVMQGYFLSRALGVDAVSLWGEPPRRVSVVPNVGLRSIEPGYQVLVNKDSLPEMPVEAIREYLEWARDTCDGIFFSCNQEAYSPFRGEEQPYLPGEVQRVGAFRRLRRDSSWVRGGYAEEIYELAPRP